MYEIQLLMDFSYVSLHGYRHQQVTYTNESPCILKSEEIENSNIVQGQALSDSEKSVILALNRERKTIIAISAAVNRCRKAVRNVIAKSSKQDRPKKGKTKGKLMVRAV